MSITEATYWDLEITDAEIDREADAGDFILAAEDLLWWTLYGQYEQ